MISQSSWLYAKNGIAAVENSPKIEVESAHLWRAPLCSIRTKEKEQS
jgi:hypothetical protein